MAKRSGARAISSSTARIAAMPLPMTTSCARPWPITSRPIARSHAGFGEVRGTRRTEAPAQVVPPGERQAGHVEGEEDRQREMRPASHGDRGAEAARDQITAAGTDRTDEAERGGGLDARRLERERPSGFA